VDLLSATWDISLSESNARSGFRKTGIYPLDRKAFDKKLLNQVLLEIYNSGLSDNHDLQSPGPSEVHRELANTTRNIEYQTESATSV
jgi:hypothetical protein